LDYSKGIPERINAFKILLEKHPELMEKVSLVQIAVPSRENISTYLEQKREIDHLIGQVNGQFGTASWQPITYIHKVIFLFIYAIDLYTNMIVFMF
jgi:trehalose 6-phosphate synthase/phosphatase